MTSAGELKSSSIGAAADPPRTQPTVSDRLYAWRDRLLASRRFQRWSAGFPLTRPIARAQAQAVFDLCAGFVYAQVLLAVVRLGVLDLLAEAPLQSDEIAKRLGLETEPCRRLLDAAVALKLLSRRSRDRYGLGMLGAAIRANPGAIAMVEHNALLYADLSDPVALLRRQNAAPTLLSSYWAYARSGEPALLGSEATARYTALMSASQSLIAEDIIEAYPLGRHRRLLDVGGGDGTLLATVARRVPGLQLSVFDLPSVASEARARLEGMGLSADVHAGSFFDDELPSGADVVTLVRILLDHDDTSALRILQNARRAIRSGGTVLVAETLSGMRGAEKVTDAYFGMYLMAMGSGRPRTLEAVSHLLVAAGFQDVRLVSTRHPMLTSLIKARAG
jgi:demethylspheroidene O-methyltransferase